MVLRQFIKQYLKQCFWLALAIVLFVSQVGVGQVQAAELDEATRTVPLDPTGETVTLSIEQAVQGRRLFSYACAQCHVQGITKTNPNVGLDSEALAGAVPPLTNVETLVAYMQVPMSYDGEFEISEFHPSKKSADIYPKMRNLTDDDLVAIAGHILLQPKVQGSKWGAGKTRY